LTSDGDASSGSSGGTWRQCAALNALYEQMWWYSNACQPVLHLVEKTPTGTRVRRKWDVAQTPRALRRAIYAERDRLLREVERLQVVPPETERPATSNEAAA
jgi:hypothetical protein